LEKPINYKKSLSDKLRLNIIEGEYDKDNTIVVQEDGGMISHSGLYANPTKLIDVKFVEESFEFPYPENVINQENLTLAIELYSNYHFERTDNARFITLVTVLEALTPRSDVSDIAKKSLDVAKEKLKAIRDLNEKDSKNWNDINHVVSRLGDLKTQAITTRIRTFIKNQVLTHDLGDHKVISKKVGEIYGNRSTLLHDGKVDEDKLKENLQFLRDFVPKLLKAIYRSSVSE
jgi:hypothetical protein